MTAAHEPDDLPTAEFAVIGNPVAHSLSPQMHRAAFAALGLPYRYVAIRVEPGAVGRTLETMREKGYRGVNVTIPHKAEALAWSKSPDAFSRRVGACNTLNLATGEAINTDGPGFLDTLGEFSLPIGATVTVLGAGGSARAVVLSLVEAGYRVRLYNRTRSRAEALVADLGVTVEVQDEPDVSGCRLVVNATSTGLTGDRHDLEWGVASHDCVAYDLAYGAGPTSFMAAAAAHGLRSVDGRGLLVAQGARSFAWWIGQEPSRTVMLRAVS
ncbi:MAG: shikimate dehydrogenase [Fimbriimonadaceae bacterium]|nr:shikimate dehydrogenase [Fimbriimonadaceae bacterium]